MWDGWVMSHFDGVDIICVMKLVQCGGDPHYSLAAGLFRHSVSPLYLFASLSSQPVSAPTLCIRPKKASIHDVASIVETPPHTHLSVKARSLYYPAVSSGLAASGPYIVVWHARGT